MRKLIALVLTLILAFAAVSAVAEGKLVVYTPNPDAEIQFILNTFAEKYDVEIEMLSMGTGECYTRLVAEKDAPIADVMFGGVETTWTHDYPDLFQTYVANGNDKLPAEYQQIVLDACYNNAYENAMSIVAAQADMEKTLVDNGMTIIEVDKALFNEAVAPAYEKLGWTELRAKIYEEAGI